MKILITGAKGMLADTILRAFYKSSHYLFLTDREQVSSNYEFFIGDLSNYSFVNDLLKKTQPDLILHLAANTDVDYCERNNLHAVLDNFVSTKNIVDLIKDKKTKLIFFSSASIFPGNVKEGYKENDEPVPKNFYATTKFLSEKYIGENLKKHYLIIRLGWLVGHPLFRKKFLGIILNKIESGEKELNVANDVFGSLSFADDVSKLVTYSVENFYNGIIHCVSGGYASRYELLNEFLKYIGLSNEIKLIPVNNDSFPLLAKRPKYEILNNNKLKKLRIFRVYNWKESLQQYVEKYERYFFKNRVQ